jgi:hypothetical protein
MNHDTPTATLSKLSRLKLALGEGVDLADTTTLWVDVEATRTCSGIHGQRVANRLSNSGGKVKIATCAWLRG